MTHGDGSTKPRRGRTTRLVAAAASVVLTAVGGVYAFGWSPGAEAPQNAPRLVAYWPLADNPDATQAVNAVTGGSPMRLGTARFAQVAAPDRDGAALPETNHPGIAVAGKALTGAASGTGASWSIEFIARAVSNGTPSGAWMPLRWTTKNASWYLLLTDAPDGDLTLVATATNSAGPNTTLGTSDNTSIDSQWHQYRIAVRQSGLEVALTLSRDGVQQDAAVLEAIAGEVTEVSVGESTDVLASSSVGHVKVWSYKV